MTHWESLPFFAVSVTLAAVAVLTLAANPRSSPHRYFAAFLLLVSLNFGADWLAKAYPTAANLQEEPWFRLSRILNPFDAAALLYFASIYPRRVGIARRPWAAGLLLAALGAFGLYFLLAGPLPIRGGPLAPRIVVYGFFASCYLAALVTTARNLVAAEFATTREALRPLLAGLLVAVAPRVGLLEEDFGFALVGGRGGALALRWAITIVTFAAVAFYVLRSEPPSERQRTKWWIVAAAVFTGCVLTLWVVAYAVVSRVGTYLPLASSLLFAIRWLFFGAVVAHALTRHAFLDMDKRLLRSATSRVPLLAASFGAMALFVALRDVAPHDEASVASSSVLALGVAVVALVGVGAARGARSPFGDPADRDLRARKLAAYRGLVEAELESGHGEGSAPLAEHRRRLGLARADHEDIVALVSAERALRMSRGPEGHLPTGYRIERTFPAGATCWTSLATAPDGGEVVVKVLKPEWRANERVAGAFLAEARALATVRHPNVVRLLAVHDQPPALVLERAAGGSLADHVGARGPLRGEALVRFARDLLAGLAALHAAGLVHRDVKPENVLLAADGRALIADFGSSRPMPTGATRVRMTAPGHEVGTVLYMAPEQVRGAPVDARADLYAAAATLVFAATGRHYLGAEGLDEFEVKRRIIEVAPVVPPDLGPLAPFVAACLRKERDARPTDAAAAVAGPAEPDTTR